MNNYLVNPSGIPKRWQAGDFLQEHYNKDIKTIFNLKNSDIDDKFMRESISLNIAGFSHIKDQTLKIFGLSSTGKRHAVAKRHQDINVLAAHFQEERFFEFIPGRLQPYKPADILAAGYTRLLEKALQSFLDRTLRDPGAVQDPEEIDAEIGQEVPA